MSDQGRTRTAEPATTRHDMEEAFSMGAVAPLEPSGPAQHYLEAQGPVGAQKVAVYRDEQRILQKIRVYAQAAGSDFYYRWEVKNSRENRKDVVEGASVKAALTVARLFGNCETDVRVKDEGSHWIFYARFTDFETGYVLTRAFQQRKSQNTGMKDKDRALDLIFQIGQSKAIRNVICNALAPFTEYAFDQAKQGIVDKIGKNIEKFRAQLIERFEQLDVDIRRPEALLGLPVAKWLAPHMARLIAEIQTVNDGMGDPDEMWPVQGDPSESHPQREDFQREEKQVEVQPTKDEVVQTETKQEHAKTEPAKKAAPRAAVKTEAKEPVKEAVTEPAKTELKVEAKDSDPMADALADAISKVAGVGSEELEALDDQISASCDSQGREDLRKLWNEAYVARKAALRAERLAPAQTAAKKEEPAAKGFEPERSEFGDWYRDMRKQASRANDDALKQLDSDVSSELVGSEDYQADWKRTVDARRAELKKGGGR